MHQNRASPFANDFSPQTGVSLGSRNVTQFCPFQSQKQSPFASDFDRKEVAHLRNFQRTLSAIGPYEILGKFIWTNHWSIPFPGEIRMDQSLVQTFSWGNSYGPMVLKVLLKFPPTLVLVHRWLFPASCQWGLTRIVIFAGAVQIVSVATPAEPRGEKINFFLVQIFGCEKLLIFVEKCR